MGSDNGLATIPEIEGLSSRMQFRGEIPVNEEIISPLQLGEGLMLTSNRTVELSVEFATKLLQMPEFIVNNENVDRNLRDAHVAYLVSCMQRGLFRPEWVVAITCELEEALPPNHPFTEFRMNGQHTAWARIEFARLPDSKDYRCPIRHMKYKAKTIADMRILYTSIDRGAPRTAANVVQAHLTGTPLFAGASRSVISLLAAGLSVWLETPGKPHLDPDTKAVLLQTTYKDVVQLVKDWLVAPGRSNPEVWRMFKRAPICAALYETFNKLPSRASEFWDVVASGVGIVTATDPRYKLRERLKGATLQSGRGRKEMATQEDMYSWAINAWNSWRSGKEVQALKGTSGGLRPKAK